MKVISCVISSFYINSSSHMCKPQFLGVMNIAATASHAVFIDGDGLMLIDRGSSVISLMSAQSMTPNILF